MPDPSIPANLLQPERGLGGRPLAMVAWRRIAFPMTRDGTNAAHAWMVVVGGGGRAWRADRP
jgi:hypothetical protein